MTEMNLIESIRDTIDKEMANDDRVLVMGEDVGRNGGVFRATDGLREKYGSDRIIDTPLSESGIVGTAIGLAIRGMRPIAELQFMGFSYPAFDQIISHASRIRNRSRGVYTCPLTIRSPMGGGVGALEHHEESTESIYAHIPGLKVAIPSTPTDAKGLLTASIRGSDPVLFLEPKKLYRSFKEDVPDENFVIPFGKANVVQEGTDVTVISWGAMTQYVNETLKNTQYSVEFVDLRTLSPFDIETVVKSVKKTGRAVIVHEAAKTGGFGAEISATINEECILYLRAPIIRVTGYDTIFPLSKMEMMYLPTPNKITKAIEYIMSY